MTFRVKFNNDARGCKSRFVLVLCVFTVLSLIMVRAYFPTEGVLRGYDTFFHLSRLSSINEAIKFHHFPFYIDSKAFEGYGYATNLFYSDFVLVPFALLVRFLGIASTYKLMLVFTSILCGMISYYSMNRVLKNHACSFVVAVLYTFSDYRMIDMSVRGALGEYLSFMFVPLVFWGAYELILGNYKKNWYILGIGFACLLLTHLISTLLVGITLFIFLLVYLKALRDEPKRILYLLLSAIFSILISSVFLLPMLEQMASNAFYYQKALNQNIAAYAIPLGKLLEGMFCFSDPNKFPNIGFSLIIPLLARIFIKKRDGTTKFADISAIVAFVLLVMCTSFFPWNIFPLNKLSIIQFPWRILGVSTFLLSCSTGIYLTKLFQKPKHSTIVMCSTVLISISILMVQGHLFKLRGWDTITNSNFASYNLDNTGGAEYIPLAVPSKIYMQNRGDRVEVSDIMACTSGLKRGHNSLTFDITGTNATKATVPLLYYKGYKASVDGKEVAIEQSKFGLVEVSIPSSGHVLVWFAGTWIQRIGIFISLLALIGICLYIFCQKREGEKSF